MDFAFVKIPLAGGRARPGAAADAGFQALHAQLDDLLAATAAGTVAGWGPSMDDTPGQARGRIAWHRIDVDLAALDAGLPALREALRAVGVPEGTSIHFTRTRRPHREVLGPAGWREAPPA